MNESDTGAEMGRAETETETVTCRPGRYALIMVVFLAAIGIAGMVAAFTLHDKLGNPAPTLLRWFFVAGGVVLMVFPAGLPVLHCRIVADETGLRWRGTWHGWRRATWAQVSDYYTQKPTMRRQSTTSVPVAYQPMPVIVTENGTIGTANLSGGYPLSGLDDLKRIVQARATSARIDKWQPLETRRVDEFPQIFRYFRPGDEVRFAWRMAIFAVVMIAIAVGFVWLSRFLLQTPLLDAAHRWTGSGGLLFCYAAIFYLSLSDILAHHKAWKRRGESITVTPETVRHDTGRGTGREWAWRDVSDYFYRETSSAMSMRYSHTYTLALPGGNEPEIVWDTTLHDAALLLAIVREYAPTPQGVTAWRDKGVHEKTGGSDPATWQSGAVGMGGRVFRYWGGDLLTLCVIGTAISAFAWWLFITPGSVKQDFFVGGVVVSALPTVWGWICFFRSRIETDDMGITRYTPLGKTFLPWFAVADYREWRIKSEIPTGTAVVVGQDNKRITLYSMIRGYDELRGEIERNAPAPRTGFATVVSGE